MAPTLPTACLLLLLCPPPISCVRSQGAQGHRLARQEHHPGHTARRPKVDDGKMMPVIDVADDFDNKMDSRGEYTGASLSRPEMPDDFTICGAFMSEAATALEPSVHGLFRLNGVDGKRWGYLNIYAGTYTTEYFGYLGHSFSLMTSTVWFPLTWTLFCVSLDTASGRVAVVVDGHVLEDAVHHEARQKDDFRPSNLNITLGYSVDEWGFAQEFTAQYSNLNIFSRPLFTDLMVAMTRAGGAECGAVGDFLSWDVAEWALTSQARIQMVGELAGPCTRDSQINVFTASFTFHGAATNENKESGCMEHCQKIGKGRSPPVRTLQELETLQTELAAITPNLDVFDWLWLSATDQEQEGVWLDYYTGERLENYTQPWYPGHDALYGGVDNCLIRYTDTPANISWGEGNCLSYEMACPCQYSHQPILRMRGGCSFSEFDVQYTPKQLASNPKDLILVGLTTRIQYNDSSSQWLMTDGTSGVTAVSMTSKLSYVLGKHEWMVTGDVYQCNKGQPYTTYLKLSGCNPEGEFTCNDGQCVVMEERCNQIVNCRDKSDERGCQLVVVEEGYNKKVPPIVPTGGNNFNQTNVEISISLLKIVSMEEVQHKIDLQFEITLEWKENRATYHNLKDETSLNALTDAEITTLWLPYVIYANTDMKDAVKLMDDLDTTIVVTKEGNFTRKGVEALDEIDVFEGKDNALAMYQTYTKSFQCLYNLQKYPFDTQVRKRRLIFYYL